MLSRNVPRWTQRRRAVKTCELCRRRYFFACVPCMERYGVPDLPVSYIVEHPVSMAVPLDGAWVARKIAACGKN